LNKKCKDEKSANSFPSGHVAEILSIGLSYLGAKEYGIGLIVIFNAVLIALATLFLRYHYFCDIIMAIFLAFLSFELNYFFGYKKYLNYKKSDKEAKFKIVKILNPVNEYEDIKI
jgi:hypothetical protein